MTNSWVAYFTQRLKGFKDEVGADGIGVFGKDREGKAAAYCHSSGLGQPPPPGALVIENIDSAKHRVGTGEVVVPIRFDGNQLGCLHCESRKTDFFNTEKLLRLEAFAAQLAVIWKPREEQSAFALDQAMEKLKAESPQFDWAGIYRLEGDTLYLTAFRGAPTPHPIIPKSKGICGAAVAENATINIPDVTTDERYLSCDIRTRSELVVPIRGKDGQPIGEIDIDSHSANVFGAKEQQLIEALAVQLASSVSRLI